jgi:CRP/FNR family transcriptional regulator
MPAARRLTGTWFDAASYLESAMQSMPLPLLPLAPLPESNNFMGCRSRHLPSSSFAAVCALLHISDAISDLNDEQRFTHLTVRSGQRVHLAGQACDRLFAVLSGCLKTVMFDELGKERVVSFPLPGDLIGADGIANARYMVEAVALTPSELVDLPLATLAEVGRRHHELEGAICGVMSRGLVREQVLIGARAGLHTHARMARFLLHLSRHAASGNGDNHFELFMQRADMANYLGMAEETVSRTLSALEAKGLISIERRTICIKAPAALRTLQRLPRSRSDPVPVRRRESPGCDARN